MEITFKFLQHTLRLKIANTVLLERNEKSTPITKEQYKKYATIGGFLAIVFVPRLIGLGNVLTIDEPLWISRGQSFMNAVSVGNFDKTLVAGQPGVTTAWLIGISAPWQSLIAAQASIGLATGVLILGITYFLGILIGKKWGMITGIFLALDPFLIAHSRLAHTDALLALFYVAALASLLCGFMYKKPQRRYIIMSALLAAGAILTKIFGLILIPTALLMFAINAWYRRVQMVDTLRLAGLWLSACIITIFLAWPALWLNADTVYSYMFSRSSLHAEGTREQETTSAPWYYVRETFFRLSVPVTVLLPFAIWQWRKKTPIDHVVVTAALLSAGILFAVILNTGSDKSDRYILFTHLTLVILAPLGLRTIVQYALKNPRMQKWAIYAISLPIVYLAIDDIRIHPYYLAHYNRLYPVESYHKLGWGEGLEQAASWMQHHHPNAKVLTYYPRVFDYFYNGEVETITHLDDARADYAVLYRSMFERGEHATETAIVKKFIGVKNKEPEHIVTVNGLPYAWIFPVQ